MALEDDLKRIQQLNAEIKQLFRDLNRTDAPPIFTSDQIRSAQDFLDSLKRGVNEVNVELNTLARSFRDSVNELSKQNTELGRAKSVLKSISNIASEIVYENNRGVLIEDKTLDRLQKRAKLQFESLKIAILSGSLKGEQLKEAQAAVAEEERFFNQLKKISRQQQLIKKDSGVKLFIGLEAITNALPGLNKLTGAFKEASEAAQKQAKFNLINFGNIKGMTKAQKKQFEAKIAQQKLERQGDIATLKNALIAGKGSKFGKDINKTLIDRLGLTEQLRDKNGDILQGSHAAARIQKLLKKGDIDLAKGKGLRPITQLPKSMTALKAGFKALGPAIKKAFAPLFLLQQLLSVLKEADKQTADLAKNTNITFSQANLLRLEFTRIANASGDTFVTTKGIQESFSFINSQLGSNVMLSEDLLVQFTKLREASGLTNEELYGATQLQLTSGKTLNKITGEILAQSDITATTLGVQINEKQVLKDIGKISAATTLSLSKNPKALAQAVTTARAFGMELSQVEKMAEGLLNFEQSITNELKAELLLGKNINLERARLAALNNEVAIVAEEIASQIGTSADFAAMNNIQQKALAEAVGMSREELAKTLFVQENLGAATGKAAEKRKAVLSSLVQEVGVAEAQRRLEEEGIDNLENQAGIQERFNKSVEKLKELFVLVAEPILAIANGLMPIVEIVGTLIQGVTAIGEAFGGVGGILIGLIPILLRASFIARVFAVRGFAGAIAAIFRSFSAIPFGLGIPFAIAAVAGLGKLISSASSKVDDFIKSPGYGKRMLYDEGEISLFNDKDTIVAGTDLFKPVIANDMISMGNTPSPIEPIMQSETIKEITVSSPPPSQPNSDAQELIAQNQIMINLFRENFRRQEQQTTEQTTAIKDNKPVVDTFGERYG